MSRKLQHLIAYVLCIAMIFTTCIPTVTLAEDVAIVPTEDVSIATETPISAETPVVEEATAEPTAEPTVEPTEAPMAEPTAEPTEEPTAEPTEEPTAEPVVEEPTAEPTAEPVVEEPTAEPTEEPTAEPNAEPTEEPAAEEPAVDYAKSVAENEAFAAGYAKVNGNVEVTADAEGENVIATLATGSVVYVAERPESGVANELVKIGFYAEEAGVMEGYAAAKALYPLDEAAVAALQGVEKYHGHALPAADVTLPVADVPANDNLTADAAATETPAADAEQTADDAAATDAALAAPVVTVDKTEAWTHEAITFTVTASGATQYLVKEVYADGYEDETEIELNSDSTYALTYENACTMKISFRAYVNGEWTPYSEPITVTVKSLGKLDWPETVTAPKTITTKQDLSISWTAVENAETYVMVLQDLDGIAFARVTTENTSITLKYGSDIRLKQGEYTIDVYARAKGWDNSYSEGATVIVTEAVEDPNVTVSDVTVTGEQLSGKEMTASATVTGGSGLYAYNYWLFDSTGTIVDRKENTFDTSWTFNAPKEGVYLMRIYATDFTTEAYADGGWFYVQSNDVAVSDVTVTGEMTTGQQLTTSATVTGGTGLYAYNYWLFDSTGTIVDRKENTFDTSWTFTAPAEGVYLMRIYATDFTTEAYADGGWFYVAGLPEGVIGLNAPVTYKLRDGQEKVLAFTAPADGTYYFVSSDWELGIPKASLYADEDTTEWLDCEDNSTDDYFLLSHTMKAGETVYLRFYIKYWEEYESLTVTVRSTEPLHVIEIGFLEGSQNVMYGTEVPIDVLVNPKSDNLTYNYYLISNYGSGDVVQSKLNATENKWTFNAPTITDEYQIKVVVSNGSETAVCTDYLYVSAFKISTIEYDTSSDTGELTTIRAYHNGSYTNTVFNYYLLDAQGNTVASNLNSNSNRWTLTESVAAGTYTAKVVASCNGYTAEKTATVRSGELARYVNTSQTSEGSVYVYLNVASYVKTWDESFLASYWLLDESGTVVAENLNTTLTSFMFDAPAVGGYYTVRATVAYKGATRTYEKTSYFAALKTIQLDQTLTITNNSSNWVSNRTYFFFEAPEDGTYYIRANGDVGLSFSGDGRSVEAGVDDVCTCYDLNAGDSVFFAIRAEEYGTYTVTVQKSEPVYIDSQLYIEAGENNTATVTVDATGALAYNYYLLDASGQVVLSKLNTTDTEWTFTAPGNDTYQAHVVATNFVETVERYSQWWTNWEFVEVELDTPLQTYGSAIKVVFKAQEAGYYDLNAKALDGSTITYVEFIGGEGYLDAGEEGVWNLRSIQPTSMELTVKKYSADGTSNGWEMSANFRSTYIGGYPLTFQISSIRNAAGEAITPVLRYELHSYDGAEVLASDWTYDHSYTFTLPESSAEYYVRVYATMDGVNFSQWEWYIGCTCAPGSLIYMTEGVAATTSTPGQVFVFQAPEAGEYRFSHRGDVEVLISHSQNMNDVTYLWGTYSEVIELEKGEWVYIASPYDDATEHSVTITRCNRIDYVTVYNEIVLAGKPVHIQASANDISWDEGKYLTWTMQLYTKAGQLVDTKSYSGNYYCQFDWIMPQQSGEYFVRAILNDGVTTEYLDSSIFTVYDTASVTTGTSVNVSKDDYKMYKFVAPSSGMYEFSVADGEISFYNTSLYWKEADFAYENWESNAWIWHEVLYMTKGEMVYIKVYTYDATTTLSVSGGNGVMTTGDFLYEYNEDNTGVVITEYMGTDANVVVPTAVDNLPVVAIGDSAFEGNRTMTSVDLPDTVQSIGVRAFANCTSLTTMN